MTLIMMNDIYLQINLPFQGASDITVYFTPRRFLGLDLIGLSAFSQHPESPPDHSGRDNLLSLRASSCGQIH